MSNLPGARSGGMTHHIQGPHLIPNVGREAMLNAEVVRRKPKAKAKVESEKKEKRREEKRKEKRERRREERASSVSREEVSELAAQEARRISEERKQLQLLKDMQERKKKQETERKKNLGGVFALSADDFEKEEPLKVEKPSLPRPERPERRGRKEVVLDQNAPGSGFAPWLPQVLVGSRG